MRVSWSWLVKRRENYTVLLAASDLEEESRVGSRTGNLLHIRILQTEELTGFRAVDTRGTMSLENCAGIKMIL